MKAKINKGDNPRNRIIEAAMKEFSINGLKGGRVENITKNANVNKAMLFYYFGSKKNLYELIIKNTVELLMNKILEIIHSNLTVEEFLENFPAIYIDYFSRNKGIVNMLSIDLIQNSDYIANFIGSMFKEKFGNSSPVPFHTFILKWYEEGKIIEKDPVHFMLNIMSLTLFHFIIKPIPEAIFNIKKDETREYYEYRKKSIINLLKRGVLK